MTHRLAPAAETDLDQLWLQIARAGNADAANRQVDAITDRFHLLAEHPRAGRRRDDLRAGLRSFPVENRLIIYRVENNDAVILRIVDGRRDLHRLFPSS